VWGQPLEIAGLDYVFGDRARGTWYTELMRGWPSRTATPRILLNHDPRAFALLPAACAQLVLSGHTHGGQVGVQWGKAAALTVVGLVEISDQGVFHRREMTLYVTRCVGFYGYPMRLDIPPAIALLTLRAPRSPAPAQRTCRHSKSVARKAVKASTNRAQGAPSSPAVPAACTLVSLTARLPVDGW